MSTRKDRNQGSVYCVYVGTGKFRMGRQELKPHMLLFRTKKRNTANKINGVCCTEGVCLSFLRRNKGWQTSWKTPVCGWRMRWTSTGKWWINWDRTDTSSRKRRKKCRRWEGLILILCNQTHTQSGLFALLLTLFSSSLFSLSHCIMHCSYTHTHKILHWPYIIFICPVSM